MDIVSLCGGFIIDWEKEIDVLFCFVLFGLFEESIWRKVVFILDIRMWRGIIYGWDNNVCKMVNGNSLFFILRLILIKKVFNEIDYLSMKCELLC